MNKNLVGKPRLLNEDENLSEARIAFREEINPEDYRIFLDVMFDPVRWSIRQITKGIDKFVRLLTNLLFRTQKKSTKEADPTTRKPKTPPFWLYVLLYESSVLLSSFSISAVVGELHGTRIQIIPLLLFNVLISFWFIILVKSYFDRFTDDVRFELIDYVTSIGSLNEIRFWFDSIRKMKAPFLWGVCFSLAWVFLGPLIVQLKYDDFIGWGPLFLMVLANFPIGTGGFYLWISRNFRIQAKLWDFKIYEPNPSKSLVIKILSKLLSLPVTIGAFLSVLVTLAFSVTNLFSLETLFIAVICGWYPMLSLFVRNHIALASIITRAKQKKLFELQNTISAYEHDGLDSTDRIEFLQKLMDYHDRIASTPNSALNFRIALGFINTLFLPLLTLLLTNLDLLIDFFS